MKNIIFVCTGNTCRSPMAEGIANTLLKDEYTAKSFGLSANAGESASQNAVIAMQEIGIDISKHKARQLTLSDIESADIVIAMGVSHFQYLRQATQDNPKIVLLQNGISDPFMQSIDVYRSCRDEIRKAIADTFLKVEISQMDIADVAYIAQIEAESFSTPWSKNSISSELSNQNSYFLVARFGNKPIGYIGCHLCTGEAYMANIAVKQEYRGLSIGKALINSLISYLKERDFEFLTLEVRQSNDTAKGLYRKLGFEKVGERKNFYIKPSENADIYTLYF